MRLWRLVVGVMSTSGIWKVKWNCCPPPLQTSQKSVTACAFGGRLLGWDLPANVGNRRKNRVIVPRFLTELKQARSDYTQAGIELAHLQSRLHTQNESEQRLQKKIVEQTMQIETLMRAQRGEAIRAGS